jgi:hypothetical protein
MMFQCSIGSEIFEAYPDLRDSIFYSDDSSWLDI